MAITWGLCFVLIQAAMPSATPLLSASRRSVAGGALLAAWLGRPFVRGRLARSPVGTILVGISVAGLPPTRRRPAS